MAEKLEYSINQLGAKILDKHTKSFSVFVTESGTLEFFMLYIVLAEHSDKDNFKDILINHYEKENNDASKALVDYLKESGIDDFFNSDNYEQYFGRMAYTTLTDNALSYFKDILVEVVRKQPNLLMSNEQEELNYILSFDTMDDLVKALTEKKIKKLFYGNIDGIKKFFKKRLNIDLFKNEEDEINFALLIKQRNLIVHNRSIITEEFANEFIEFKEFINEKLIFSYEQLSKINTIINNIIVEIDIKLQYKYNLEIVKSIQTE